MATLTPEEQENLPKHVRRIEHVGITGIQAYAAPIGPLHPLFQLGYRWIRYGCEYERDMGTCVYFHKDKWYEVTEHGK